MNSPLSIFLAATLVNGQDVSVRVDLSALPEVADDNIHHWVVEQTGATLEAAGHRVVTDAEHVIEIQVSWYGNDDENTRVAVQLDNERVTELQCPACSDSKWLEMLDAEVAKLAERLAKSENEPAAVKQNDDTPEQQPQPLPVDEARTDAAPHDSKPLTWLGWSGIVFGAAGAALTTAGIVDVARRQRHTVQLDTTVRETRNFRDRGIPLAIGGGVVLTAGLTIVFVDLARQRKKRRVAIQPSLGRNWAGFRLQGTF